MPNYGLWVSMLDNWAMYPEIWFFRDDNAMMKNVMLTEKMLDIN